MKLSTFKCTFTDKKVQKPNDRVTLVTLTGKIPVDIQFLSEMSKFDNWLNKQRQVEIYEILCPTALGFQVTGKAVRAENDTDNPVLAQRIAEARAKKKLYRFCEKLLFNMYKEHTQTLSCLFRYASIYQTRGNTENEHLRKLLGQV